jgi:hypothetical protein
MHFETQTESDYSDNEKTIKSTNIQTIQINSPKINKPIYEKDKITYPIAINTNFLRDTEEEVIASSPVIA